MKKLLLLFALFYPLTFGQGWNNTVTTSINESNLEKMDAFTNKDGNHLLIKRTNGNIVYYNFNSSGTVDSSKTVTLESSGNFPNIVGSNDKIYALYKAGNYIKGKYSTNGGSSWSALQNNISTSANECNGVDAVYELNNGVHLVYATQDNDNGGYYFETYYYKLNSSNQWVEYKNVTDYGNEVGGVPSITVSNGRVHVSYNTHDAQSITGDSKTRDKNLSNNTWYAPQLVSDGEVDDGNTREKLVVRDNKLYCIFYDFWSDMGYGWEVQVKSRDLTGTYWPGSYTQIFLHGSPQILLGAETTANGNLNVINRDWNGLLYTYFDGDDWSDVEVVVQDYHIVYENQHLAFSTASNDLFVMWKSTDNNNIKYVQYDVAPLAPTGLAISSQNYHPRLDWNANLEPDINLYKVEKYVGEDLGWVQLTQTANHYYVDLTESYCTAVPPMQCPAGHMVYYRIKAVDLQSHISNPSGSVGTYVQGGLPYKVGGEGENQEIPAEYDLSQNYPNPFNPSTQISYSLVQDADVTLIVYDVLGTQVAELINEAQEKGNHSITFNSNNLASGIYIYRLVASKNANTLFAETKQMILLK